MQPGDRTASLESSGRTIDELAGQLIWAFINNKDEIESIVHAAQQDRIAGVWLLPAEMRNPADTVTLINLLQGVAPTPLLIGVDAEAGMGSVMEGATHLPSAMAIGATGEPEMAREAGSVTGAEAVACGINAVAAPVLDVNINPRNPIINTRSFGGDPQFVAEMGFAFAEGVNRQGDVLPIGKHFPGHGDTSLDSHLQLDTVNQPRERLDAVELLPFRVAIADDIPLLMTAHVAYPALDPNPGIPATLSAPILTGLLRHELRFEGAVVTDAMNMYAVAHNFEAGEAAIQAVLAGCDLILTDQPRLVHMALVRAVRSGRISADRLHEGTERVRRVKERIFGPQLRRPSTDVESALDALSTGEHIEVAERIAAASITLVDGELTPPSSRPLIIATRMTRRNGPMVDPDVREGLAAVGWDDVDVLLVDPVPDPDQIERAVDRAVAAGWCALLHFNRVRSYDPEAVGTDAALVQLADAIKARDVPLAVVSMGSPYALLRFERAGARLCSYTTCDASLHATLRVLRGEVRPSGRLPVRLE